MYYLFREQSEVFEAWCSPSVLKVPITHTRKLTVFLVANKLWFISVLTVDKFLSFFHFLFSCLCACYLTGNRSASWNDDPERFEHFDWTRHCFHLQLEIRLVHYRSGAVFPSRRIRRNEDVCGFRKQRGTGSCRTSMSQFVIFGCAFCTVQYIEQKSANSRTMWRKFIHV